jgi:diguanylate cyclase (GGDEF)-like protein
MLPDRSPNGRSSATDAARAREAWLALDAARAVQHEDSAGALATAGRCLEVGEALGSAVLRGRALALQGMLTLNRGDLRGAFALAAAAALSAEEAQDDTASVEVTALEAHLSFFSGAYREALRHAEHMIALADRCGGIELRVYARRCACLVLGNLAIPDWPAHLDELLSLAIESGNRWEEAVSRNDHGHHLMTTGALVDAEREIDRGLAVAQELAPHNRFVVGLLRCTRAEILLGAGRADAALADAELAIELLGAQQDPNPYLLGMSVRAEVQALLAAGRPDDAWRRGRHAIERLGEGLPHVRSMILQDVAGALRDAGRSDEAYHALAQSAELERIAFRELSELQRDLDRALLEAGAARRDAEALTAKNHELETMVRHLGEAHAELELRTEQLEELQAQLREQADRDWLTGLHNRRYLARRLEGVRTEAGPGPCSLAVLDLDHFKAINDRFGHDVGDLVLVRVATLLLDVVRTSDIVARTGGEEFLILMPFTQPSAAAACAERVRHAIADEPWHATAPGLTVTASVGVASAPTSAGLEMLAKVADRRLYAAKDAGRNRVDAVFSDPMRDLAASD